MTMNIEGATTAVPLRVGGDILAVSSFTGRISRVRV